MSSPEPSAGPPLPPRDSLIISKSKSLLMQVALEQSLTAGSFIDTKIYAFSRRRSTGFVDKPLPIYASSRLLRANSTYFDNVFNAGFSESTLTSLRRGFPEDKADFTGEYDYDSDSDLEDEVENSDYDIAETRASQQTPDRVPAANGDTVRQTAPTNAGFMDEQRGWVIVIPDVAFSTLKAAIYFLYTGEVNFTPLCSSESRSSARNLGNGPKCSPKSIYRLADKLSLVDLKEKARANIALQLMPDTIVTELRSSLALMYDDVRDMIVEIACKPVHLPVVLTHTRSWIEELSTGDYPHEASILMALFQKVATLPPNLSPPLRVQSPVYTAYPPTRSSTTSHHERIRNSIDPSMTMRERMVVALSHPNGLYVQCRVCDKYRIRQGHGISGGTTPEDIQHMMCRCPGVQA
ncbi:hypothetical protein BDY19DRAFT_152736 [Irpex rosettiformis]|uniref:Uncharacterized protein n=1 Tax=Irpex rosettiformis TaxID=378272 RepID=A0ACB8U3B7_9APHY|nr:hypothetical protein BDY19DRAFT_152736 [Irpex rosettiformis]